MSIMSSVPIIPRRILPRIKSEKCRISHGFNSSRAEYSSVDCQSLIMVSLKMCAPSSKAQKWLSLTKPAPNCRLYMGLKCYDWKVYIFSLLIAL